MNALSDLAETLEGSGYFSSTHLNRLSIPLVEHGEVPLPLDVIKPDGSLDIYEDVQKRFSIEYKSRLKRFIIRAGGWVGHIPLNDRYVLNVDTRVPIANLERMLAGTDRVAIEHIGYSHNYRSAIDRPQSLLDLLADHFLLAVDRIRDEGLLKHYREHHKISSNPFGRVNPFGSALQSHRQRKPVAAFSAYWRTQDNGPNRVIRHALERLLAHYSGLLQNESQRDRISRIQQAHSHFIEVGRASLFELSASSIAVLIKGLPWHRQAYADALRLGQYLALEWGLALRGSGGLVVLPAIVVDMATIFEDYARGILKHRLRPLGFDVLDGNVGGDHGAEQGLFEPFEGAGANPTVNPDIVIAQSGATKLIVDAKYKPAKNLPDRAETNQLMTYSTRYACQKVMALYPNLATDGHNVRAIGKIGEVSVLRGGINLSSDDLAASEKEFAEAIALVLMT